MELRPAVKSFAENQEAVLRQYDAEKGAQGWREASAQTLASLLCEKVGKTFTAMFGHDDVCSFLIASLRDHVETSGIDLRYDTDRTQRAVADLGNFCAFIHDNAGSYSLKNG